MLALCGSAIHKIDQRGRPGTEMVTHEEIEALAAFIEVVGGGLICQQAHERKLGQTVLAARQAEGAV